MKPKSQKEPVMKFSEQILLLLSKKGQKNLTIQEEEWNEKNALSLLEGAFPHLLDEIKDKMVVDFGCGNGYQTAALARTGAKGVLGIDTNPNCLARARKLLSSVQTACDVQIGDKIEESHKNRFDIVISQNSFEHFNEPDKILNSMKALIRPGGKIYVTFGPPWYAPYGSHMQFFLKIPWANIIFSEEALMAVRSRFRNDGAKKFAEVEGGLNKMTIRKFNDLVEKSGLNIELMEYDCVKGLNFLSKIPYLRELFINNVRCILSKAASPRCRMSKEKHYN